MNSEIWSILSIALGVGFINGALPGPIMTAMFTHILRYNFRSSLKIAFAAGGVVAIVATALFSTFHLLDPSSHILNSISIFGAFVLLFLAWKVSKVQNINTQEGEIFTVKNIVAITLLNSSLWLSWLVIFLPQAFKLKKLMPGGEFIFLFTYELAWLSGFIIVGFIFSRFRHWLTQPKIIPYVFKIFSLLLALFACKMLWDVFV